MTAVAPAASGALACVNWLMRRRLPKLRFERDLEERFVQATAPARLRHFVRSGAVALLVFILFLPTDWLLVPDVFKMALWMRLGFVTPMALGMLFLGWRYKGLLLMLPEGVVEAAVAMTGVVGALTMCAVLVMTDSPMAILYRNGFVPVLVFGNLVQRLRFRYATVFSLAVLAIYFTSFALMTPSGAPYAVIEWPMALMITSVAGYTLVSNFRMEYEERQRFLAGERALELREELKLSYEQLDALSRRDPLTGVANRRHFDEYIRKCWDTQRVSGGELALLLIDVDHFKAYNDRYGHPAGDECLRHVAQQVRRQVPQSMGLVARWGGEEFVVVLPHMGETAALTMAQSVRQAVQALALRHEGSATASVVTISVGVAAAMPRLSDNPPDDLVAAADVVLYRAKSEGRNCCVVAERLAINL